MLRYLIVLLWGSAAAIALVCADAADIPPPPEKGVIRIIQAVCDGSSITAMTIVATGPATVMVKWDNKAACGTPV